MLLNLDALKRRAFIKKDRYGYHFEGLPKLTRVTTILNEKAKPQLERWKIRKALEAYSGLLAKRSENGRIVLGASELIDLERLAIEAPTEYAEGKADKGTRAHEIAEAVVTGHLLELSDPDELWTYVEMQRWWAGAGLRLIATEVPVYHEGLEYGGQLDALFERVSNGRLVLGDWKSGGVWPEAAYQMAAYEGALFAMGALLTNDIEFLAVHIPRERGTALMPHYLTPADQAKARSGFLALLMSKRSNGIKWVEQPWEPGVIA